MKKLLAVLAFLLVATQSVAQWQVPNNNLPIGRGVGNGFNFLAPGTSGNLVVSNGTSWLSSANLGGTYVFSGNNTFNGSSTFGGNVTFNAAATFNGATTLGSAAVATTPAAADNDTSVATTAFVQSEKIRKNWLYNSSFYFVQRRDTTSGNNTQHFVGTGKYTVDRWWGERFGNLGMVVTRIEGKDGLTSVAVPYKIRIQRDTTDAFSTSMSFCQSLPYNDSRSLAGRSVTLSFFATGGADWSSATGGVTSGFLQTRIVTGTGATAIGAEEGISGLPNFTWTGKTITQQNNTVTTTRTRFSHTTTLNSTVTQVGVCFNMNAFNAGAIGAQTYVELDSLKFEIGSAATEYVPDDLELEWARTGSFYEEWASENTTGVRVLTVPFITFSNGQDAGPVHQLWAGTLYFKTRKRHRTYVVNLATGPGVGCGAGCIHGPSHVTVYGGTSIYDLVWTGSNDCNHRTESQCGIFNFKWVIDGSHPAFAVSTAGFFAVDGNQAAGTVVSSLTIDAEIN